MPFLKNVRIEPDLIRKGEFPFTMPLFSSGLEIEFTSSITFLVGENGSGKSTLIEAIAENCGFNRSGGSRNHVYSSQEQSSGLASALKLSWMPKVTNGFFMRAESFYNFAAYLDEMEEDDPGILDAYGGRSLLRQSHGESFLSLFTNRFHKGIYLLDEPEAALSPSRQLSFLVLLHELELAGNAQFIIATHSPILIGYPGAVILSLDGGRITPIPYEEAPQYQLTRDFLNHPQQYLNDLFAD